MSLQCRIVVYDERPGRGEGEFQTPFALTRDVDGRIYVADTNNNRVQIFEADGTFVAQFGSLGTGDWQFQQVQGIAVDGDGNIYVSDTTASRIVKVSADRTQWQVLITSGSVVGKVTMPMHLSIHDNHLWVADAGNQRVQKFAIDGTYISHIGTTGSSGSGNHQFYSPNGVAIDSRGFIYVADTNNRRVQKFDSTGTFVATVASESSGLSAPVGLTVDAHDNLYIADYNMGRIQKISADGEALGPFGEEGSLIQKLSSPAAIHIDPLSEDVIVSEVLRHRILKFNLDGTQVMKE